MTNLAVWVLSSCNKNVILGSKSSSSESSKPSQEHEEIKLKVSMEVLGKRQHNLWCKGTVQEVQTAGKTHLFCKFTIH